MFRQFILALFLIALALPAMATPAAASGADAAVEECHGAPAQDDDNRHGQNDDGRIHGCIGCIAPISGGVAVASGQVLGFTPFAQPVHRLTGTAPRPSLPPPRG